jgi:nitroreductase
MRSGYQCAAVDVSIAVTCLTLTATALGLGTCWIGAFDPKKVAAVLSLPLEMVPVHVLPLGYPAEQPEARPRKASAEVTRNDLG